MTDDVSSSLAVTPVTGVPSTTAPKLALSAMVSVMERGTSVR